MYVRVRRAKRTFTSGDTLVNVQPIPLGVTCSKAQAQRSNVSFATFQRKETFELRALSFVKVSPFALTLVNVSPFVLRNASVSALVNVVYHLRWIYINASGSPLVNETTFNVALVNVVNHL